jgi:hypothetical protein
MRGTCRPRTHLLTGRVGSRPRLEQRDKAYESITAAQNGCRGPAGQEADSGTGNQRTLRHARACMHARTCTYERHYEGARRGLLRCERFMCCAWTSSPAAAGPCRLRPTASRMQKGFATHAHLVHARMKGTMRGQGGAYCGARGLCAVLGPAAPPQLVHAALELRLQLRDLSGHESQQATCKSYVDEASVTGTSGRGTGPCDTGSGGPPHVMRAGGRPMRRLPPNARSGWRAGRLLPAE